MYISSVLEIFVRDNQLILCAISDFHYVICRYPVYIADFVGVGVPLYQSRWNICQ